MSSFFGATPSDAETARQIVAHVEPLSGEQNHYRTLLKPTARACFALLVEASHGTHEFYQHRADITRRLITEQGVASVAVEADWPDAWRVNRYVRGLRCLASSGFRPGCGATRWCLNLSSGCVPLTTASSRSGRLAFTGLICIAFLARCRPLSTTCTRPTRKPPAVHTIVTAALTTFAPTASPMATRRISACIRVVSMRLQSNSKR